MRGFPNGRRAGCVEFALTQSLRSSAGRDGAPCFNRVFYQINNNSLYLVGARAVVARLLMYNGQKRMDASSQFLSRVGRGWHFNIAFGVRSADARSFRPSVAGKRAFDLSAMR
jgi:hypothetical protein